MDGWWWIRTKLSGSGNTQWCWKWGHCGSVNFLSLLRRLFFRLTVYTTFSAQSPFKMTHFIGTTKPHLSRSSPATSQWRKPTTASLPDIQGSWRIETGFQETSLFPGDALYHVDDDIQQLYSLFNKHHVSTAKGLHSSPPSSKVSMMMMMGYGNGNHLTWLWCSIMSQVMDFLFGWWMFIHIGHWGSR